MFNLDKFIADSVTSRSVSMFTKDIESNKSRLVAEIEGKSVCVIGGAGSIGSSFIKAVLRFKPRSVVVIDLNENGLAELIRDIRSTEGLYCPDEFRCYTLNFADPIFRHIFREEKGFDIVANFSAHKHVRSEKDRYSVQALIENNDIKAKKLMDLLTEYPPKHFFCVSTDKAANPVNIMGASKRIMEDLVMAYNRYYKVTTARFANVAFSNGSLPDGWLHRLQKKQPVVAPNDVRRYFVSPEESGQICMLACILGKGGEIFFPKLKESQMLTFSEICSDFIEASLRQAEDESSEGILLDSVRCCHILCLSGVCRSLCRIGNGIWRRPWRRLRRCDIGMVMQPCGSGCDSDYYPCLSYRMAHVRKHKDFGMDSFCL